MGEAPFTLPLTQQVKFIIEATGIKAARLFIQTGIQQLQTPATPALFARLCLLITQQTKPFVAQRNPCYARIENPDTQRAGKKPEIIKHFKLFNQTRRFTALSCTKNLAKKIPIFARDQLKNRFSPRYSSLRTLPKVKLMYCFSTQGNIVQFFCARNVTKQK